MKSVNVIGKYMRIYVVLVFSFLALLCMSYLIPVNERNMKESSELLVQEGVFPNYTGNDEKYIGQDNYTDSLMLNIISTMSKDKNILKSVMQMNYRMEDDGDFNSVNDLYYLYESANTKHLFDTVSYARYWHGYVVYLKPLMFILNFSQLRVFMTVCIYTLLIICIYCIATKIGIKYSIGFLAGFILVDINHICYSVQYFNVFALTLGMLIFIATRTEEKLYSNFEMYNFIFGGIICFVDLLTTPIITFGLCGILFFVYFAIRGDFTIKEVVKKNIKAGIAWVGGYVIIWGTKWMLGSIIIGRNVFLDALKLAEVRTSVVPDGFSSFDWIKYDFVSNFNFLFRSDFKKEIMLIFIIIGVIAVIKYNSHPKWINIIMLLLFAGIPYIWYIGLKNHSGIHAFFTYRNQILTIVCVFEILIYCIDEKRVAKKVLEPNYSQKIG